MSKNLKRIFEGRVAAITGGGKGLGKAYALWLAQRGCAVIVNNRAHVDVPSSAQAVVDEIIQDGGTAIAHNGAIDNKTSAANLIQSAVDHFGKLDILICNAGIMPEAAFADANLDDIEKLININLLGTIYPLQAAWQHMLVSGYGRIVLTGSTVGIYGHAGVAAYGASRGAVLELARSLTLETPAEADIKVNTILPFAYTNMSASPINEAMDKIAIDAITPDKIAPTVGWLCSEACNQRGAVFHASALKVTRAGIVESAPVAVDPNDVEKLSEAQFSLEPIFEPIDSTSAVTRLLSGAVANR